MAITPLVRNLFGDFKTQDQFSEEGEIVITFWKNYHYGDLRDKCLHCCMIAKWSSISLGHKTYLRVSISFC